MKAQTELNWVKFKFSLPLNWLRVVFACVGVRVRVFARWFADPLASLELFEEGSV